jgi:tryptophan-rich sensory protein
MGAQPDDSIVTTHSLRAHWQLLVLFVLVVMGIGFVVGLIAAPGPWFEALAKPAFILPAWISTPIWVLLCICFAVAGWRLWLWDSTSVETRLWLAILILSWWYTPVFFLVRAPMIALLVIAVMAILMTVFVFRTWNLDRISALLFIPCTLWVMYAAAMTSAIAAMNT